MSTGASISWPQSLQQKERNSPSLAGDVVVLTGGGVAAEAGAMGVVTPIAAASGATAGGVAGGVDAEDGATAGRAGGSAGSGDGMGEGNGGAGKGAPAAAGEMSRVMAGVAVAAAHGMLGAGTCWTSARGVGATASRARLTGRTRRASCSAIIRISPVCGLRICRALRCTTSSRQIPGTAKLCFASR